MAINDRRKRPQVEVPDVYDMEDETFLLHLEKRHANEVPLNGDGKAARHAVEAWVGVYRAFHERLHQLSVPGQHDHTHEEFE